MATLALVSGCSSLPDVDETRPVWLETDLTGYSRLEVDVDGNPEVRPGALAAEGGRAAVEVCGPFYMFCALVTVPAGAVAGAIITAVETLPEEQAHALNYVTAQVASRLSLDADFRAAMRSEGARHGITFSMMRADAWLRVQTTQIFWNVGVGNKVALEVHFTVTGESRGKSGRLTVRYVSASAGVHDWVAGTGELIEQALIKMVEEASVEIWQKILDYDEKEQA
mgnify:FL=1